MQKKKFIAAITAIALTAATPLAIHAYQVATTGAKDCTVATMYGYMYRASSSGYSFSAETTISSNPYGDADLKVSLTVYPYGAGTEATASASTSRSSKIAVSSGTAAQEDNASSATGSHSATIYNGAQHWGNSGTTSWSKGS